jgi:translation initiation factor IF-3
MDYGKFMFDKSKAEKQKAPQQQEKEISFRYTTGDGDIETKVNQAKKFLDKGMKVKLVVRFEKREKAHKDLGFDFIRKILDMLKDVATVEMPPKFEGQNVAAKIDKKKEAKEEKPARRSPPKPVPDEVIREVESLRGKNDAASLKRINDLVVAYRLGNVQ